MRLNVIVIKDSLPARPLFSPILTCHFLFEFGSFKKSKKRKEVSPAISYFGFDNYEEGEAMNEAIFYLSRSFFLFLLPFHHALHELCAWCDIRCVPCSPWLPCASLSAASSLAVPALLPATISKSSLTSTPYSSCHLFPPSLTNNFTLAISYFGFGNSCRVCCQEPRQERKSLQDGLGTL